MYVNRTNKEPKISYEHKKNLEYFDFNKAIGTNAAESLDLARFITDSKTGSIQCTNERNLRSLLPRQKERMISLKYYQQ